MLYWLHKQVRGGLFVMWTKSKSLLLSRIMTLAFFLLLVIGTLFLPHMVRGYIELSGKTQDIYMPLLVTLYASVPPAAALLVCLYRLLHYIGRGEVFTEKNVFLLRVISWFCFIIAVIYGVFCFRYVLAILIGAAAAFVGIILRVVKNVFEQAIAIKTENDFTI